MSTTTPPAHADPSSVPATLAGAQILDHLYRMTVDEYEQLADSGVLRERRVELVNGWLARKMTTKPPHVVAVDAAREALAGILPAGWWLRDEKPVRIPEFDEPEPDISVVRGSRQDYRARHPGPGEIEFVIEVSDTSLAWDRREKLAAYARAAVPSYWILNLIDRQLEVFTSPESQVYRARQVLGPGDKAPVVIDGAEAGKIAVAALLD
jgi:Uma2 family endonuclease